RPRPDAVAWRVSRRRTRDRPRADDLLADLPTARAILRHRHDGDQRSLLRARELQRPDHRWPARNPRSLSHRLYQHDLHRALEIRSSDVRLHGDRGVDHGLAQARADEDAAAASGVNVLKAKLQGMALSAFLTGIGGGLFAMYVRVLDPPSLFSLPDIGVKFALISLIGGIGTIIGPVVGAILIVPLESWLRGAIGGDIPGGHLIVLGAVLVAASLFLKRGIV